VRGEVTVVVSGAVAGGAVATHPESLRTAVAGLEANGMRRKEAIAAVAVQAGLPKREVYQVVHVDD
jgi:16S rRNA (cytidine1402-2'-O)-methyltransferase